MSREAMKLALEALEMSHELADTGYTDFKKYGLSSDKDIAAKLSTAITALREALAEQPAQQALDKKAENARELGLDYEPDGMHHNKPVRTLEELHALSREVSAEQSALRVIDCHATGVCVQSGLRAEQPAQTQQEQKQKIVEHLLAVADHFYDGPVRNLSVVDACEKAINKISAKEIFKTSIYEAETQVANNSKVICPDATAAPQPAQQAPVAWGVDWGKAGDIPCGSIIKRLPGGGIEVVAVEYAPYSYTPPPAQQEPVAWLDKDGDLITNNTHEKFGLGKVALCKCLQPAQRTWVGLTDKEAMQICVDCGCLSEDWLTLLDAIEAKLRSKNT